MPEPEPPSPDLCDCGKTNGHPLSCWYVQETARWLESRQEKEPPVPERMNADELAATKAEHQPHVVPQGLACRTCYRPHAVSWPCLPYRLADAALAEQQAASVRRAFYELTVKQRDSAWREAEAAKQRADAAERRLEVELETAEHAESLLRARADAAEAKVQRGRVALEATRDEPERRDEPGAWKRGARHVRLRGLAALDGYQPAPEQQGSDALPVRSPSEPRAQERIRYIQAEEPPLASAVIAYLCGCSPWTRCATHEASRPKGCRCNGPFFSSECPVQDHAARARPESDPATVE